MTDEQKALVWAREYVSERLGTDATLFDTFVQMFADAITAWNTHAGQAAMQAQRDAQAAEIARLREALGRIARLEGVGGPDAELQCADMASAALAQETQP
jgi:hypothetical protein